MPNPDYPVGERWLYQTEPRTFTYTQATVANIVPSHVSGTLRPGTTVLMQTATVEAGIYYILTRNVGTDNETVLPEALYIDGITIVAGMFPVRISAVARASGFKDSEGLELEFAARQIGGEQIFFGQLHAHTIMSDGAGTPEWAFEEARDIAQLDFFVLSDHSNWFDYGYVAGPGGPRASNADGSEVFNLREYNRFGSVRWERGNRAAADANTNDFLASNGFEFTWSGGPGHINTFNTTGWVCRNNAFLNTGNNDLRLQRYYDLLRNTPESISMFNHPGRTFGNFHNFAHFDHEVALRIPLIEVANGEGAIGAGGYFPSYEQFTMALDRGWLLAPVNSQDNHRGLFGWANEGRVAIYTNDFSHEGMWQAFRDRAAYSTEIRDMEITFYMNNEPMGTVLHHTPSVAEFSATIYVPETPRNDGTSSRVRDTYTIRRASLVTNGGVELAAREFNTPVGVQALYNVEMPNPVPGYYFLRVIAVNSRGQERIAVTAPIWIGRAPIVGITEVTTDTFMPLTGEDLTLTTLLFNDEQYPVTLVSLEYSANGVIIGTVAHDHVINPGETPGFTFDHAPTREGVYNIQVRAIIRIGGVYREYSGFIDLTVRDSNVVGFIGIDASHFNEYVDGNYRNSFTNFAQVAAGMNLVTVVFRTEQELIAAANNPRFSFILMAPPGRHVSIINDVARGEHRTYSEAAVQAVADFVKNGGTAAVVGFGNFNDTGGRISGLEGSMSHAQNRLLAAMGSNIRIGDASHSAPLGFREAGAHQHDLRYRDNFNLNNPFMQGIIPYEDDDFGDGQLYRNFSTGALYVVNNGGALVVNAADVESYVVGGGLDIYGLFGVDPMVFAHPGSWTLDSNGSAGNQGAGRPKFPVPGAAFPRYAHPDPDIAMQEAPPQGTGNGQRPVAGGRDPGQHLIAASQQVGDGTVLVFASHFFSNFDVRPELDFFGQLPNANLTISEHILRSVAPEIAITSIDTVRQATHGQWFSIEGVVTSGLQATGDDAAENRGFMNSIYIQDGSGGINLFEVTQGNAAGLEVGMTVRARGYVSSYQGETQLTVHLGGRFEIIDRTITPVEPKDDLTTVQIASPAYTGWLVRVEGVVSDVVIQPGTQDTVMQFTLTDDYGSIIVFMRDYITPGVDLGFIENGVIASVVGFASHGENAGTDYLPRIRVRDRGEITLVSEPTATTAGVSGSERALPELVEFNIWLDADELNDVNIIEFTVRVNDNLSYTSIKPPPGFELLGAVNWTPCGDGGWRASIMLMSRFGRFNFDGLHDEFIKMSFSAHELGDGAFTLENIRVVVHPPYQDSRFVTIPVSQDYRTVTTQIVRFADYTEVIAAIARAEALDEGMYTRASMAAIDAAIADVVWYLDITHQATVDAFAAAINAAIGARICRFDLNRDGVVDLLDIGIALLAFGLEEADYGWFTNAIAWRGGGTIAIFASDADVNYDGVINILDIMEILANFHVCTHLP